MKPVYFFTGFPGFISCQLLRALLKKHEEIDKMYCLVLPALKKDAEDKIREILQQSSARDGKIVMIEGDITRENLGIDEAVNAELRQSVTHVFHLAAIYDLAVPKEIAYRVNVDGTRHVNEWVLQLENLQRYTYFSTAYVAGTRTGLLKEDELLRPPAFKNFYEETKFAAELFVEALKKQVPVTIIRPGIVKGHSKTGETTKFDGPYFFLNFMDRLKWLPLCPKLGKKEAVINLVPIDFIVEATLYLSHAPVGVGKTYHLTDPDPYPVTEVYEMMLMEMLGKRPKWKMPLFLIRLILSLSIFRKFFRVEKETLDYLVWEGQFDASHAQRDLREANITCPDLKEQIPSMVRFYLQNKHNESYQIRIR